MICKCNRSLKLLDPKINRCPCGMIYDGEGNHVEGSPRDWVPRVHRTPPKPIAKVGTALESLIPEWAVADRSGCDCKSWVRKMDSWGVSGCQANREAIISRLVKQKERLIPLLRGMPDSLARLGAGKLLDKAIKKASEA